MGMDVSGCNPHINKSIEQYTTYQQLESLSFKERDVEFSKDSMVQEKYWEEQDSFYKDNPGIYFRNNCWWWRPLWTYCAIVDDGELISEDTYHSGHNNDGAGLDAKDSVKLAVKLQVTIEDGSCQSYKKDYEEHLAGLPPENCFRCNNNNHGNNKKRECKNCDKTGVRENFGASYPFSVDNVKNFIAFLKDCGGFEIW